MTKSTILCTTLLMLTVAGCEDSQGAEACIPISKDPKIKLSSGDGTYSMRLTLTSDGWTAERRTNDHCTDIDCMNGGCTMDECAYVTVDPDPMTADTFSVASSAVGPNDPGVFVGTVTVLDETVEDTAHFSMVYWEDSQGLPIPRMSFQSITEISSPMESHEVSIYGDVGDELFLRQWRSSIDDVEIRTQQIPDNRYVLPTGTSGRVNGSMISSSPPDSSQEPLMRFGRVPDVFEQLSPDEHVFFNKSSSGIVYATSTIPGVDSRDLDRGVPLSVGFPTRAELGQTNTSPFPTQVWIFNQEDQTLTASSNAGRVWDIRSPSGSSGRPIQTYTKGSTPTLNRKWTFELSPTGPENPIDACDDPS